MDLVERAEPIDDSDPAADDDSFEAWYLATWPRLVRLALGHSRSRFEAEDLAADTCATLLRRWHDGRPDDPTGWAVTVVINAARKRGPLLRRTFGAPGSAEQRDDNVDLDLIEAIRRLPQRQRAAVSLRYLADFTQAEVAKAMGIAPGTAAALLNQARTKLRTELENP